MHQEPDLGPDMISQADPELLCSAEFSLEFYSLFELHLHLLRV